MAKVTINTALSTLRGKVDNWVYRKTDDGFVVARRPIVTAAPSAAQLAIREQFRAAAAYAKAVLTDPVQGPRNTAAAAATGRRPFAFAVADYLNPPTVSRIDAAAYHGAIGDVIKVNASDDFELMSVKIAIRGPGGAVLEQGAAMLTEGLWHYTATTAIAAGLVTSVDAVATDRPGHSGSLSVSLTE